MKQSCLGSLLGEINESNLNQHFMLGHIYPEFLEEVRVRTNNLLTEEIEVNEDETVEEKKEEEIVEEPIQISQVNGTWENRFLWIINALLLIAGGIIGIGGHLLKGWSWIVAMGPDLVVVFGIVCFLMAKGDKRIYIMAGEIVLLLLYPAIILGEIGDFISSIQTTIATLRPNIIFVQNMGGYDSVKYSIFEYFRSLPFQLIIAMAIIMMSYIGIRIARKVYHVKFHLALMLTELLIVQGYFWGSGIIDAQTSLATNTIFCLGAIMSGYWSSIVDCFLIPRLSHVMKSDSTIIRIVGNIIMAPIMMIGMALAVPITFALMVFFVNETALTMTLGFKIITQGYIVGALINGALRELYIITRRPVKRSYIELNKVLE